MAKIYANLIINGDKKFEDVPEKQQDQVVIILKERGYEHLVPQKEKMEETIMEDVSNDVLF